MLPSMVSFYRSGSNVCLKAWIKRKLRLGRVRSLFISFFGGAIASYLIFRQWDSYIHSLGAEFPSMSTAMMDVNTFNKSTSISRVEHSDTSATDGFLNAWRQDRETCKQWMSMQAMSNSYLDAYIIGSQKGATSEVTKRLFKLGVRRPDMKKEWHYFNKLEEDGSLDDRITTHEVLSLQDLKKLRYAHYKTGFPDDTKATVDNLPGIDRRKIAERLLAYDGTVEAFHTDKAAFMAHALTPHAKIVATVRIPIERAISQFNMMVRTYNRANEEMGKESRPATPEWFHELVTSEIEKITRCGYDAKTATIDRPTSKMLNCTFGEHKIGFDDLLYVTRGLYHVHIGTWRNYFPDHRILILSFVDLTTGRRKTYQDLAKFLCIRPFPEDLLKSFEENGSKLSYGQQVAKGMENKGTDSYDGKNNAYLLDINPETRKLLNDFYRPANRKLEALRGKKMYDYE